MTKVYILSGSYHYEGDSVIGVYANRDSAENAMLDIQEHKRAEPPPLEGGPDDWTDEMLAEWNRLNDAWRAGLPNGGSNYDSHWIAEHEVKS